MIPKLRIDVTGVTVSLAGKTALDRVSWSLGEGEHWAFLGSNGAGKSTLLRLLRGDVRPDQTPEGGKKGSCVWTVNGEADTSPLSIKYMARMVCPEQQRLYTRRGWSITGLGMVLSGFADSLLPSPPEEGQTALVRDLARDLGADRLLDMSINAMSHGQLRLILLTRALISKPRLLLLDEPFDGLDAAMRETMHAAVNRAARSATIIVAAHRAGDLPRCISHALSLDKGRVVSLGPLPSRVDAGSALKSAPEPASNPAPAPAPETTEPEPFDGEYALEMNNADVYVDRVHVLRGLTWKLPVGQNWRVAGANGSGKSTLLRVVAGLEQVALGGEFRWFNQRHPSLEARLRETGYLSDQLHAAYTYDVTGLELVLSGFDGSVGLWRSFSRKEKNEARQWIEFLGLSSMAGTLVSRLSSGTARRFFLARALVGPVRLLLLDEPCSGLDAVARNQFLSGLDAVLASGVQCLYVSHHNGDVPARVTHELVLDQGKIVRSGKITI